MGPALRSGFRGLAIAASLCAALVATGCGSGDSGPPSTKPRTEAFVSDRYDFSVALPAGSIRQDATVDWDASCLCGLDDPAWAAASVDGRTLAVVAKAVDSDTDLAGWRARIVELAPSVCHDSKAATEATLGGADALAWTASCSDGYNVIKLVALHHGRGYVVLFASPTSESVADNQKAFDSLISSFEFVE